MIIASRPSPWVRPGWYVAVCVTDGHHDPQGWPDERERAKWVGAHTRLFPDHEVHQVHGAEVPTR